MASRRQARNTVLDAEPALRVKRSQLDAEIERQLRLGQELQQRDVPSHDDMEKLRSDFYTWDEFNEQLLRSRFSNARVAEEYQLKFLVGGSGTPQQELKWLRDDISRQIRSLGSIRGKLELYESELEETDVSSSSTGSGLGKKVFVVHGHDGAVKLEVARFVESITGERPVILHEQPDSGRTIIEKFEDHASEAGFALVLLTADDLGRAKGASGLNPRARQNVVLELGFFIGRLGRSKVVALYDEGVELPSDLHGVLYKPFSGNWQIELAKELRAAGVDIDLSKLV